MNIRQKKIIRDLMTYNLSTSEIAKIMDVTPRTIRNDINDINLLIKNKGAEIIKTKERKLELNIKNIGLFNAFLSETFNFSNLDISEPENRIIYIALKYLFSSTYIKLEDFLDELYISKSTLQNDFKEVKDLLDEYRLAIEFKPNYGSKILGKESDIRRAISNIINKTNFNNIGGDSRKNMLLYDQTKVARVYDIVLKNINNSRINLSDLSLNNLIVHIVIAIRRVEVYQYINKEFKNDLFESYEYDIAQDIVFDIEDEFNIIFPEVEVYYITTHLMGIKLLIENFSHIKTDDQILLENLAKKFIKEVEKRLGYRLSLDEDLLYGILLHLQPAVHRFKNNMEIRNPLLESIKINYPEIFEAAIEGVKIIEDEINISFNEDEIGYLAIHLGAAIERIKLNKRPIRTLIVCTTGVGSAQLLRYKLERKFAKQLDIRDTTELYKLKHIDPMSYDLIISTVPLGNYKDIPFIVINDILGENKFELVNEFINSRDVNSGKNYIDLNDLYLNKSFKTKEEILRFLCDKLLSQNRVPENFYRLVMERESKMSTCFGNLIAIPHPIKAVSTRTFLTLMTLERPILWGDKQVQLVILVSYAKNESKNTKRIFNRLIEIIDDEALVKKIIDSKSLEQVYLIFDKKINMEDSI